MTLSNLKRSVRKILRANPLRGHDALAERAAVKQWIAHCASQDPQGRIAICRNGQDCDGVRYESVRYMPAPVSVFAFLRDEDAHREYLDGPESMRILPVADDDEHWTSVDTYAEADGY